MEFKRRFDPDFSAVQQQVASGADCTGRTAITKKRETGKSRIYLIQLKYVKNTKLNR